MGVRKTCMIVVAVTAWLSATHVGAQAPALLPVQGVLTDDLGEPIDGVVSVTFALYDRDTGGSALFEETVPVTAEGGSFSVYLGNAGAPLDLTLFARSPIYLGITVESDAEMAPRFMLGTTPYAAYAQMCGDANTLSGMDAADFAPIGHTHAFNELTAVPTGLADGDNDTTYSAGTGLTLGGTTFSADTSYLQRRVGGSCAVGSSIRSIAADGSVVCETDDSGAMYSAGTGLLLSGSTFSVDQYTNLARRDSAAGDQDFDSSTLYLAYGTNRVGVRNASPDEELDVVGDVEVTGDYYFAAPRRIRRFLGGSAFESPAVGLGLDGETVSVGQLGGGVSTTLHMPSGALFDSVVCYFADWGTSEFARFDTRVYRRPLLSRTRVLVASDIYDPPDYNDDVVRSRTLTFFPQPVDAATDVFTLSVILDAVGSTPSVPTQLTFYGCMISYTVEVATAH